MSPIVLFAVLLVLSLIGYWMGRQRSVASADGNARNLHSRPGYYGSFVALWCGIPALLVAIVWLLIQPMIVNGIVLDTLPPDVQALPADRLALVMVDVRNTAEGNIVANPSPEIQVAADKLNEMKSTGYWAIFVLAVVIAMAGLEFARRKIVPTLRARNTVEQAVKVALIICAVIAVLTTVGIVGSLVFEAMRFFAQVSVFDFLFGLQWSPQTALRADQAGSSGAFGAIPLVVGTLVITVIAMIVAVPIGLMSAIYLSDYATPKVRAVAKPVLEVLAGIPTVVFGFFAALTVAPLVRDGGNAVVQFLNNTFGLGIDFTVSSESALAAGVVMGVMIIPFVSSLSDDVINAVPQSLRDGAYGLGATKSECIKNVVLPAALPGIFAAVLLAISKAIGETMIVVMAAGFGANLSVNPLEAVTTITVQIATLLVGDQEFDSPKTLSAFALGLLLFCATLVMNIVALRVVRKYREKYD